MLSYARRQRHGVGYVARAYITGAWTQRLAWYAERREARRKREDARLSAARAYALVDAIRCDAPTGAARGLDDNSAELLALTSELGSRGGYSRGTLPRPPDLSRAQEVEGSTLQIPQHPSRDEAEEGQGVGSTTPSEPAERGEARSSGSRKGRGRRGRVASSVASISRGCETPVAGCEEECAVAGGASERVLGSYASVTEVRTGPRGERIEVLSEGTLDVIRQARLDKTNKWRLARGLEPKKPWWGPGKDGPDPAKAPPEPKSPSPKVVRRRKLADGTTEEVEIAPRRKKK